MRRDLRLLSLPLLVALSLAGCDDKKAVAVKGTAGGEVLPGSVSDAMLPIDTVRSQPPLAPKTVSTPAKAGKSGTAAETTEADVQPEAEAPAGDAPAPEPAPAE